VQTAGATVALTGAATATPTFIAPNVSGTLTFVLTVTDNNGAAASDSVSVSVNLPPVAEAGTDQIVLAGAQVMLNGAASHDDGGTIISYAWTQTAGTSVTLAGADTATPNFTAPNASGTLAFTLTVTDDNGATASDTVTISVNLPPAAEAGPDQAVTSGATVTLNGAGSRDPDGTVASYVWVQTAGATVALTGAATATPTFIAPNASGTLTFVLTVTDNNGATASDTVSVSVNLPPVANAGPDITVKSKSIVTLNGTGSYDPDGTIVSYAWTQTMGTPVILGGADTATPDFTAPNAAETLTFRLVVTDDKGISVSDEVNIVVSRSGI
jgi:biopolymer transport protein ExbD